jgi:hypothetical protein
MAGESTSTESATTNGSVTAIVVLTCPPSGLIVGVRAINALLGLTVTGDHARRSNQSINANTLVGMSAFKSLSCWMTGRRVFVQESLGLVAMSMLVRILMGCKTRSTNATCNGGGSSVIPRVTLFWATRCSCGTGTLVLLGLIPVQETQDSMLLLRLLMVDSILLMLLEILFMLLLELVDFLVVLLLKLMLALMCLLVKSLLLLRIELRLLALTVGITSPGTSCSTSSS